MNNWISNYLIILMFNSVLDINMVTRLSLKLSHSTVHFHLEIRKIFLYFKMKS